MAFRSVRLKSVIIFLGLSFILTFLVVTFIRPQKEIHHKIIQAPPIEHARFEKSVGDILDPAFVDGNRVTTYLNGDEIFPAMLSAIEAAQKTISFESYIYWSGDMGEKFAKALADKARAGLQVHVLLDWAGSGKISDHLIKMMKDGGVEVERYHSPQWYNITRMNNRTHRKVLVIDGKVGFTGGVGIADEWGGNGLDPKRWRDTHYKVEGPVVNQMQSAFMDNWLKLKPEVYMSEDYFPEIKPAGKMKAQMFISSAGEGGSSVRIMYLMAIASARKSILLESAYFVPDEYVVSQLIEAKKRGVDVRIIVPGPYNDSDVVDQASQELWGDLLKAGIKIFRYMPALYHCKVLIIDEIFVSVGSTNFDERSFRINDEANLNVIDKDFAARQIKDFETDLSRSQEVTYDEWKNRPVHHEFFGKILSLFRSQL